MQSIIKQATGHLIAIFLFLGITVAYFVPAVFQGKTIQQPDMIHTVGMGSSQAKQFEDTAAPGEFSVWSDAMFGGMPYTTAGYGNPSPKLPGFEILEQPIKSIGYMNAGMVFAALLSFYLLMCVLGINRSLAFAGAIAFAFASYNIIIIAVGHITKAYVIAYMPITLSGMILLFKRKYLWGGILFLLGTALSIYNYHIQITYYLILLCLFIYTGYLVEKIRQKEWIELSKVTAIMAVCAFLAILPNTRSLYAQWDLGKTSLRGATELTTFATDGEKISSGLDKDYAFQWSYGRGELLTLLIPNMYGGSTGGALDSSSEFYKYLRAAGYRVGKDVQAPTYWGDKSGTSGPVYFGAVVCFLFILGMFIIKNRMKWWLFAGATFLTLLALGRNLDVINSFVFHFFPFYNKFRTPEMALVIPGLVFPIIAFWGLKDIVEEKADKKLLKKGLIWSLSISGGICLIIWWFPTLFFDFQSNYDTLIGYDQQPWYDGLLRDRAHLAASDALRSLIFVLLSAGVVFVFTQLKNKKQGVLLLGIGFTILCLADMWVIDKRYLNDSNFKKAKLEDAYKESVADREILKDKDLSYRVLTFNNPFQESTVSYYHHSVGGYSPVKLRRYQELIDHRLLKEMGIITQSFNTDSVTLEIIQQSFESTPSLNMLNTRYIIYNPEQAPIVNPQAFGNAWFVPEVKIVENADAEIAALNSIDPLQTAVVDKRFADDLKGFHSLQPDSTASIVLDSYRPNHLIYTSKTSSEQLAVFSEIYYQPGWKATIDGQPAPHFRANWILRAMLIPAGEHKIEFDFRPESYVKAAYVSSISSFLILLLLIAGVIYSMNGIIKYLYANMKTKKNLLIITTISLLCTINVNAQVTDKNKSVSLQEKFYGCICGAHIGSSMGAAVEGWSYTTIEEKYGTVEELLPYEHYGNGWKRDPGTTEDGVERQKLMITAIMRKGDRVNAEDVRAVWRTEINPKAPGNVSEPFEGELLALAKSSIPARDIGKYCDYSGLNSFARACHPIGLINAGDPKSAIADVLEVGQLYQTSNSRGLQWACVTAVAIAAATSPDATVDSVIEAIRTHCDRSVVREIDRGLRLTANCKDFREMRKVFDNVYNGIGMPYSMSSANEVVTKSICVFKMVNGDVKEAMIAAVNMGRDTDCITAIAAGISGALSGVNSIPTKWIEQVDAATKINPFTNTTRTMRENSDGLYDAFHNRLNVMKDYYQQMNGI